MCLGRRVSTLVNDDMSAGVHSIIFEAGGALKRLVYCPNDRKIRPGSTLCGPLVR